MLFKNEISNFLLVSFGKDLSSTENVLSIILINEDKNKCQPINLVHEFVQLCICMVSIQGHGQEARKPGLQHFKDLDARNSLISAFVIPYPKTKVSWSDIC